MKLKQIIKNIVISVIVGIILGIITEYALIWNISWLIKIIQSFIFWGLIICIVAFIQKDFIFTILSPIIVLSLMNITYYLIRLFKSGYTNIGGLEVYTFTGIVGSLYIGTLIYLIKNKFIYHRGKCILQIYSLIAMTIIGIIFTITGFGHTINYNLSYNIGLGIIIGYALGIIITKVLKKNKSDNN